MNYYFQTLDTNLVDDMIGSKVIEIRKKKDYIKKELIEDMESFYMNDIYDHCIFKIVNVIDVGFCKKYETIHEFEGVAESDNNYIEYDGYWHTEDDGLEKLDEFSGMLITTEYDRYLMLHYSESPKIRKFKPKYQDCYKLEWINGDNVNYYDTETESDSDSE